MKHTVRGVRHGAYNQLAIWLDDKLLDPKKSQEVFNHSPDGFEAGYVGSGPAQTALAILLEVTGERKAVEQHHEFMRLLLLNKSYQHGDFEFTFEWRD